MPLNPTQHSTLQDVLKPEIETVMETITGNPEFLIKLLKATINQPAISEHTFAYLISGLKKTAVSSLMNIRQVFTGAKNLELSKLGKGDVELADLKDAVRKCVELFIGKIENCLDYDNRIATLNREMSDTTSKFIAKQVHLTMADIEREFEMKELRLEAKIQSLESRLQNRFQRVEDQISAQTEKSNGYFIEIVERFRTDETRLQKLEEGQQKLEEGQQRIEDGQSKMAQNITLIMSMLENVVPHKMQEASEDRSASASTTIFKP